MGLSCFTSSTKDDDEVPKESNEMTPNNDNTKTDSTIELRVNAKPENNNNIKDGCSLTYSIRKLFMKNRKPKISISLPIPVDESQRISSEFIKIDCSASDNNNHLPQEANDNKTSDNELPGNDDKSPTPEPQNDDSSTKNKDNSQIFQNDNHNTSELSTSNSETVTKNEQILKDKQTLLKYDWFWGSISRKEAELLLKNNDDGTFLVRESSDAKFKYSLSFRSGGKTMHSRIHQSEDGLYSFYSPSKCLDTSVNNNNNYESAFSSLHELISSAINHNDSADNIFFYSRGDSFGRALNMMSLTRPLSRSKYLIQFPYKDDEHKALQYMALFVLKHSDNFDQNIFREYDDFKQQSNEDLIDFVKNASFFPHFNSYS